MRWRVHKSVFAFLAAGLLITISIIGCSRQTQSVVVYTALDRNFSEPIFDKFTEDTGIRVLAKYDTESTKTVGLVNAVIAEASRPRCDVFWNNEIVNTIRLKEKDLLQAYKPNNASLYPDTFKDPDEMWHGFAARARVIIVNTSLLTSVDQIGSVTDLTSKDLTGRIAMAKPLFGTTASHVACLFSLMGPQEAKTLLLALRDNGLIIESGNKGCAVNVANGLRVAALTDTDDAIIELRQGKPVEIVFPDSKPGEMGTLVIPNTLALIKDCPHPSAGETLIDYLLSPEVEEILASGDSAQIPLNKEFTGPHPLDPLPEKWMHVDFNDAAAQFETAAKWVHEVFLVP